MSGDLRAHAGERARGQRAQLSSRPDSDYAAGLFSGRTRGITAGLLLTITLIAFEAMAVGTVMPVVARELNGLPLYAWGFSAFLVASLVGNAVAGQLADARGPRVPFLLGMSLFVAGLVVAGIAPWMELFVAARAVQGFGGGALVVTNFVIIARTYGEELRPRVFAATSAAWVLPSVIGPGVGGLLAQHVGWRVVFLGLIPLVAPSLWLLGPALRPAGAADVSGPARPGRRTAAALGVAAGAVALLQAIQHPGPLALPLLAGGLVALVLVLPRLLPAGALALRRGLPAAVVARGLLPAAFFGVNSYIPLALTGVRGFTPAAAGLALTTGSLGWSLGSWWQGHRAGRIPRHRLVVAGVLAVAAGSAITACAVVPGMTGWVAVPGWIIAGLGMGLAMSSLNLLILRMSAPHEHGANTAAMQVCDTLGSALAIGLGGAIVLAAGSGRLALGVGSAMAVMVALALGTALVCASRLLPPAEAAAGTDPSGPAPEIPSRSARPWRASPESGMSPPGTD